jgi:hypothetical protein
MESVSALVRFAVENGWRVGIILFLASGGILLADAYDLPREGVLFRWLDLATICFVMGCALLAASGVALILRGVARVWTRLQSRRQERHEVQANFQTLNRLELTALRDILTSGAVRFEIQFRSVGDALLKKGLLVPVRSLGGDNIICEPPPCNLGRS